jgi:hypothetical protein
VIGSRPAGPPQEADCSPSVQEQHIAPSSGLRSGRRVRGIARHLAQRGIDIRHAVVRGRGVADGGDNLLSTIRPDVDVDRAVLHAGALAPAERSATWWAFGHRGSFLHRAAAVQNDHQVGTADLVRPSEPCSVHKTITANPILEIGFLVP